MGQARSELGADIRSTSVQNYTIFFRYRGDLLEIINVLHAHRDSNQFFRD
jgi:plasmid stabilization system protein ParE